MGPWTFYTQKDKVLDDRWESKTEIALATKEVIESTFRDHMGDICEDLDLSVRIASGGFCDMAKFTWYNSLRDWGSFFGNQRGVSEKTKKDPDYLPIIFNMPVREIKPIIMAASKKVSIRGGGNDFEVEIDCNVSGADDETTTDRITVEFFNKHNRSIGKRHSNGVGSCLMDKSFSASLNDVPAYIEVQTNGSDGYMIDELWIRKNGEDIAKHGADNDRGWCLSTDPADAGGSWRNSVAGQCQRSHRFSVSASKAKLAYSVGIDCLVSGADDEETSNRITVRWYSADGRDLGAKHRNGISTCHGANDTWSIELNEPAAYVTVSTNGSDGYLMDQIEMFVGDEEVREHGGNDSRGWCLSTDNGDHNRGQLLRTLSGQQMPADAAL